MATDIAPIAAHAPTDTNIRKKPTDKTKNDFAKIYSAFDEKDVNLTIFCLKSIHVANMHRLLLFGLQLIVFLGLNLLHGRASGQAEQSAISAVGRAGVATTFARDYQAIGVNPANLGIRETFRDPKWTFGFLEGNLSIFAEPYARNELFESITNTNRRFSYANKQQLAQRVANKNFATNLEATIFGFFVRMGKIGGLAMSMRTRTNLFIRMNENAANLAFMGQNSPYFPVYQLRDNTFVPRENITDAQRDQVVRGFFPAAQQGDALLYSAFFDGSRFTASVTTEFNLAYGTCLLRTHGLTLHTGIGARFIQGWLNMDFLAENGQLVRSNMAFANMVPLPIPDAVRATNPSLIQPGSNGPAGLGQAFDLGVHAIIGKKLHIAAAVNNLGGQITWNGNLYTAPDNRLSQMIGSGFNNYNLFEALLRDSTFNLSGNASPIEWTGASRLTEDLPQHARMGVSYNIYNIWHVGIDVVHPLNRVSGSLYETLYAIGGDLSINRHLKFSSGFQRGGNFGDKILIPIGATYTSFKRHFEMNFGIRDITLLTSQGFGNGSMLAGAGYGMRFLF